MTDSGNVTLYDIAVTDYKTAVTCPDSSAGLAPEGTITCSATYTISQGDLDAKSVTNSAYAKSGQTQSPPDSVTVSVPPNPALTPDEDAASEGQYDSAADALTNRLVGTDTTAPAIPIVNFGAYAYWSWNGVNYGSRSNGVVNAEMQPVYLPLIRR